MHLLANQLTIKRKQVSAKRFGSSVFGRHLASASKVPNFGVGPSLAASFLPDVVALGALKGLAKGDHFIARIPEVVTDVLQHRANWRLGIIRAH